MRLVVLKEPFVGTKDVVPIGILFSRSGPYADLGEQGNSGAMAAIAAINAIAGLEFRLSPIEADPQGNADRYALLAADMISKEGVQNIVGCTTLWSRKEVIPVLEKTRALLWYPCVYEGFEANENVVYVGGTANQHVLPLLAFAMPSYGPNAFLVGSNYMWGWETCRIAREAILEMAGDVFGERHVPLGDTDIDRIVGEIRRKKPGFIFNSLIGPSSHAFLQAYRALGDEDPDFAPGKRPVLSCNLGENEIARIGRATEGHLTIASYFQALASAENLAFLQTLPERTRATGISAYFAQAYAAVLLIVAGLKATDGGQAVDILHAVKDLTVDTPIGKLRIDSANNHIHAPGHIARATAEGRYEIIRLCHDGIAPDPFLTRRTSLETQTTASRGAARFRVVT